MRNLLYVMRCIDPVERPSKLYVHSVEAFKYKSMSTAEMFLAPLFAVLILTLLDTG
jgi:hypothetical protein